MLNPSPPPTCPFLPQLPFVPNVPFPFEACDILSPAENVFNSIEDVDAERYQPMLLYFAKRPIEQGEELRV